MKGCFFLEGIWEASSPLDFVGILGAFIPDLKIIPVNIFV